VGIVLTSDQKRRLCNDKFYALSLQDIEYEHYSRDGNIDDCDYEHDGYGGFYIEGAGKRCGRFQADFDYYGFYKE